MRNKSNDRSAAKLVLLGVFAAVLMAILSWSFSESKVVAGSFRLDDMRICEELNEDMTPVETGSGIFGGLGGARQICLWFAYSKARDGDFIDIVWKYEGEDVQQEAFRLGESAGSRAFFLLRQDGSVFPEGDYSVVLYCNGKEKGSKSFTVEASEGETQFSQDD